MGQTLCCVRPRHNTANTSDQPNHVENVNWSNVISDVAKKRHDLSSGGISRAETLVDTGSTTSLHIDARTEMRYLLNESQLTFYEEKGYLIIKDGFSNTDIHDLQTWVQEVHDLPRTMDCPYIPYEEVSASGDRVLCRTENFANTHAEFGSLLRGSKLLGIMEQLTGSEMLLFKEKINFKFAGSGGFQPHVDRTGYGDFKKLQHLAVLIAADDATPLNGCLEVVDESHKVEVPIGSDNCIVPNWVQAQKWVPVEMKAGDMMIFGSSLAHRSGPNASEKDRRAVYATYNSNTEGDLHDAYYERRAKLWPATHKRKEGVDYSSGAKNYAYGTPMRTIEKTN
ncbi:hypothetical protein VTL71DRAFT_7426 [Oculimacula yallundae]|uniref:Phytanoyl-CoA dioxygenase n=1 Tax=Oculimacula yallundae TaxID=86028 RepID=A0ABR4BU32_9HELO